jgi:UDP-hydrolysing UDP-N-acetyl-D-glucosamine 2-epimerase
LRKICIVTGSRAEYGLLYPLLCEIEKQAGLALQLVVTGMHLSPEFGLTCNEIVNDGFAIDEKIEMLLSSDTAVGVTKSMGLGLIGFADAWARLNPDIVVVLGDRFEIMVAVQAAMIARIPVAHLHGGELTEGAIDDAIRHSITKMSHIHFVSTEIYRARVIQLGEAPERVFNVGAIGLDNIRQVKPLTRADFEESIDFELGHMNFLVTYHPVTLHSWSSEQLMNQLLDALKEFPHARIVFTKSNADSDSRILSSMIDQFVAEHPQQAVAHTSLGRLRYLSALSHMDVVIGNSSSGIIEAPLFYKPTVNIGDRQKGRVAGSSIISCGDSSREIADAIRLACTREFQQERVKNSLSLYGDGHTAGRVRSILEETDLSQVLRKSFYEI